MGVDTQHPDYAKALPMWAKCRDAAEGQECVHAKGELYLPKLSEQSPQEYKAYRDRALFYEATGRTIDGLSGMVFRRPPTFDIPDSLEYLQEDIDTAGTPLLAFAEKTVEELLITGRIALLADFPMVKDVRTKADEQAAGARPYLTLLRAESVINWTFERINNRMQLALAVISEVHSTRKDEYTWESEAQLRALRLVDGKYLIELHRKNDKGEWVIVEVIVPQLGGKQMDFIPLLFCGPMGVGECVEKSPVNGLANVNLSHYRTTADYEHGLHFTGLPTPVVTGHAFEQGDRFALGSTQIRGFPDPQAKAYFMEFAGSGLGNLSTRLTEKQEMMAALGARMLGAEKRAAETAETAAIHRSGENSVLASLANAASAALTKALGWCAMWAGVDAEPTVELNTDYLPSGMTAQELTALVGALQAGAISGATFYDNIQRGEIARQGVDWEEEKAELETQGPQLGMIEPAPPAPPQKRSMTITRDGNTLRAVQD